MFFALNPWKNVFPIVLFGKKVATLSGVMATRVIVAGLGVGLD